MFAFPICLNVTLLLLEHHCRMFFCSFLFLLLSCMTAVMGTLESRGVLRKMSDMLETMVKRMEVLAKLENSTDFRKGEEAHFQMDRSVPMDWTVDLAFPSAHPTSSGLKDWGQSIGRCGIDLHEGWIFMFARLQFLGTIRCVNHCVEYRIQLRSHNALID